MFSKIALMKFALMKFAQGEDSLMIATNPKCPLMFRQAWCTVGNKILPKKCASHSNNSCAFRKKNLHCTLFLVTFLTSESSMISDKYQ